MYRQTKFRYLLITGLFFSFSLTLSAQGIITTVAGIGSMGDSGDGGSSTAAQITGLLHCAFDKHGNYYFSEHFGSFKVRKITPSGIITTIAGNGTNGDSGDGGQATDAELEPNQIAIDEADNLYICDASHSRVRKVNLTTGIISTFAGNGVSGYTGDGGQATNALLGNPSGICIAPDGSVFVADNSYGTIRKINSSGIVSAYAGVPGTGTYSGDGGQATAAGIAGVFGLCSDSHGNIFMADGNIRRIDVLTHVITRYAGNNISGFSGDGGPASMAAIGSPVSVSIDICDNIYIADANNNRVRFVDSAGIIHTIAGTGTVGFSGDGFAATTAQLHEPGDVGFDSSGNLYINDALNFRIRKVTMNKCTNSTRLAISEIGLTAVISLYPNPANDELTISAPEHIKSLAIHNLLGQTVYLNTTPGRREQTINVSCLPPGVYFVKVVRADGGMVVKRFVKE